MVKKGIRNKNLKMDKLKDKLSDSMLPFQKTICRTLFGSGTLFHLTDTSISKTLLECLKKEINKEILVQHKDQEPFSFQMKKTIKGKRTLKKRQNQSNIDIKDVRIKEKPFLGGFSGENSKYLRGDSSTASFSEIELHITNVRKKKTEK